MNGHCTYGNGDTIETHNVGTYAKLELVAALAVKNFNIPVAGYARLDRTRLKTSIAKIDKDDLVFRLYSEWWMMERPERSAN